MIDFTQLIDTGTKDPDTEEVEEYEGEDLTLPPLRYEKLEINGEDFDLRNFEEVEEARNKLEDYRKELREGDLYEYEGRSTELWQGGRSRLLHDELMIKLARDYHFGKHNLTYEQMNEESLRIQSLRAARLKAQ